MTTTTRDPYACRQPGFVRPEHIEAEEELRQYRELARVETLRSAALECKRKAAEKREHERRIAEIRERARLAEDASERAMALRQADIVVAWGREQERVRAECAKFMQHRTVGMAGTSAVRAGGFPVLWSWLQYLGTDRRVEAFGSTNYQQSIDVDNLRITAFPFEACAALLAAEPSLWSIQTVVPPGFSLSSDPITGLDQAFMQTNANWGVTAAGTPYFDDTSVDENDRADLYLDGAGNPYLVRVS